MCDEYYWNVIVYIAFTKPAFMVASVSIKLLWQNDYVTHYAYVRIIGTKM